MTRGLRHRPEAGATCSQAVVRTPAAEPDCPSKPRHRRSGCEQTPEQPTSTQPSHQPYNASLEVDGSGWKLLVHLGLQAHPNSPGACSSAQTFGEKALLRSSEMVCIPNPTALLKIPSETQNFYISPFFQCFQDFFFYHYFLRFCSVTEQNTLFSVCFQTQCSLYPLLPPTPPPRSLELNRASVASGVGRVQYNSIYRVALHLQTCQRNLNQDNTTLSVTLKKN